MASLLESLTGELGGGDGLSSLAGLLGADSGATQNAVSSALPAIIGALANNASTSEGADALSHTLDKHDGSVMNGLPNNLAGIDTGDGAKILDHVLGQKQPRVQQQIAERSGLDMSLVTKLLPILAPIVLNALSQKKRSGGLDAGGLASVLAGERQQAEQQDPGLGGLASILDDGKLDMSDLGAVVSNKGIRGMLGKLLGR